MKNLHKQVALIVLDGWGHRENSNNNAIAAAKTPFYDSLWREYPHTLLEASGLAVGLPEGQMGNSEIGHTTIGAGKVIDTDLVRIKKAIDADEFISNPAFQSLFDHVKKSDSTLHVMGLVGTGGVHSHSDHLFAFLKAAKRAGMTKIALHLFTDGRDTPPQSAFEFVQNVEREIEELGIGFIVSLSGRFYAMDRDNNWDRLKRVEDILFDGNENNAARIVKNMKPSDGIKALHQEGKLDEHFEPMIFENNSTVSSTISQNDGVFFFNFRADRAKMIGKKIAEKISDLNLCYTTLTEHSKSADILAAFPPVSIETTLAAEISKAGLTQAHIAETEKFPHATYFLNGGKEEPHGGESHELLASRKDVQTHDLAPKMRAEGIADKALEHIEKGTDFIFINFANPDMVGHTANVPAIIEAIEEVDLQLSRVVKALVAKGGVTVVTADHGNAEVNVDEVTGEKHTAHTINLVPCIVTKKNLELRSKGSLADLAPTVLRLLEISQPKAMTGTVLIC